jgi:Bacterial toxin 44
MSTETFLRHVLVASYRKPMTVTASAVIGLAAIATVCATGPAAAGTNGQQVSFCATSPALAGGYVVATGENQAGKTATTKKIELRGNGHCENLPNWWFRGGLWIEWFDRNGDVARSNVCEVPQLKRGKRGNWHQCFDKPVHVQLAEYIHREITRNSQSEEAQELLSCLLLSKTHPVGRPICLKKWYDLVKSGGPWDHKGPIKKRWKGAAYKHAKSGNKGCLYWFHVQSTDYILSYEFWSNIHYSYVGRVVGFAEFELRTGHQLSLPGTGVTDEGDKLMVELGLQLYEEATHKRALRIEDILDLVATNLSELTDKNKADPLVITDLCGAEFAALAGQWTQKWSTGPTRTINRLTIGSEGSVKYTNCHYARPDWSKCRSFSGGPLEDRGEGYTTTGRYTTTLSSDGGFGFPFPLEVGIWPPL